MSDALKLENQLCHRFYLISNAFSRAYRPLLNMLDITYPQYIAMMALWESDNITINALVSKTGIDGGAMSLMLKKLEDKGYLSVKKDTKDKRVKYIVLTTSGKALKSEAENVPKQMLCKFNDMTLEEGRELRQLLDKLYRSFDDDEPSS
ncbi:MarR family transcriptional regulator [Alteromonas sp. KUL49]|uniref:MarR family winged helix-turn-helix transcriptional regulator n=1 Tax=Alteromonas sp. KUL49 TaxID=2480798 RepID=UPI00102F1185|nr:MarR family transcriptional regulator [Alteromonas sp. KUL49]TAP38833.1 MarR family transcriptional regulator [Alteromonas sp. KUL49]GEA12264.1 MarR family transcriptional regulator [Alteromonas sp. KUL49]